MPKKRVSTLEEQIDLSVDKLMALLEDPTVDPRDVSAAEAEAERLIRLREDDDS